MTVVIDASVWVAARFETEPGQAESKACLRRALTTSQPIVMPWLALVEVVAAVARKTDSRELAEEAGRRLHELAAVTWSDLDEAAAADATQFASTCRLRAADAVYAAVARRHGATLVTLDQELRHQCAAHVRCQSPREWARE